MSNANKKVFRVVKLKGAVAVEVAAATDNIVETLIWAN